MVGALDQATETLKEIEKKVQTRKVIVLTDFSNRSIGRGTVGGGTGEEEWLKKAIEGVKAHATALRIIDMGAADQVNMGVTELRKQSGGWQWKGCL